MIEDLKAIVDLLASGMGTFAAIRDRRKRRRAITGLLETYFLLKACAADGQRLLSSMNGDPIAKIRAMRPNNALELAATWDGVLERQSRRLLALGRLILGEDSLAIIDPDLQQKLLGIVGNKMDRTANLHSLGATLFFRTMFHLQETPKDKAYLVASMLRAKGDRSLNLKRSKTEIEALQGALESYRVLVQRLVSDSELLLLSEEARMRADRVAMA